MRFRGGGVGHIYMRQVEPWLDATGWGTSWPSLEGQDPDPDSEPVAPVDNSQVTGDEESEGDDSEDEGSDIDDDDGEDPEQPDEDDDESDDDDGGGGVKRRMEDGEGVSDGDETDEETEEPAQLFASL